MSPPSLSPLFSPFRVKTLNLKNRIVMSPMSRNVSTGGVPGPDVAAYYRRRAENAVGLILSGGTVIDRPASRNHPAVPFFHGPALDGWAKVIDGVHAAGTKMGPQLWHVGSVSDPGADWAPPGPIESPSGLESPDRPRGEAMSEEAIADTIAAFGRAAADARRLGFDTLELHGAHGYLIDQFFWRGTNLRRDRYGGVTLAERALFAAEVIKSVRTAVGPDFPIILRVSQWKQQDFTVRLAETPELMAAWLTPLVEAGVDVLHCSQRRFWEPEFPDVDGEEGLNFAGWAKKLTGAASIAVGSVGLSGDLAGAFAGEASTPASLDNLISRLEREEFDLVAVGRALLADYQWTAKVQSGDFDQLKGFTPAAFAETV